MKKPRPPVVLYANDYVMTEFLGRYGKKYKDFAFRLALFNLWAPIIWFRGWYELDKAVTRIKTQRIGAHDTKYTFFFGGKK